MVAALIMLALVAFSNYLVIFFSCYGLKEYGAWLNKYHTKDLWCIRVLVRVFQTRTMGFENSVYWDEAKHDV